MSTNASSPPHVSVVQLAALHAGESKARAYVTVHPTLEMMARTVSGFLSPERQQRLHPLAARLAHTRAAVGTDDHYVLSVQLACWATRQVLHLLTDRASAEWALTAAEAWCDGDEGSAATLRLLDKPNRDRTGSAEAEGALLWVRRAVTLSPIGHGPANAVEFVAKAIHHNHPDQSDDVIADRLVALLTGLLDEYDRLTGREPVAQLTPSEVAALRMLAALT